MNQVITQALDSGVKITIATFDHSGLTPEEKDLLMLRRAEYTAKENQLDADPKTRDRFRIYNVPDIDSMPEDVAKLLTSGKQAILRQ